MYATNLDHLFNTFIETNNNFNNNVFPKFSVLQKDNTFEVCYALAGYEKENLNVEYDKNQIYSILTVSSKKDDHEELYGEYIYNYISQRDFKHSIRFPYNSEVESCKFENGLLKITIQMSEDENHTSIDIE